MQRLILVRHGQSEANAAGRWQGQGDHPLSALGREQAISLARRFQPNLPDLESWQCRSSDLSRARVTAEIVLGTDIQTDERLREIDVGSWEGLNDKEVSQRFPEQVAALRAGEDCNIGGGESWSQLEARSTAWFEEMRAGEQNTLAFCHGGLILSLVTSLLQLDRKATKAWERLRNTCLVEFCWTHEEPLACVRYNDTAHLGEHAEYTTASSFEPFVSRAGVTLLSAEERLIAHGWGAPLI